MIVQRDVPPAQKQTECFLHVHMHNVSINRYWRSDISGDDTKTRIGFDSNDTWNNLHSSDGTLMAVFVFTRLGPYL